MSDSFLERNFTEGERKYCDAAADRRASYAARWAAKEAVFKAMKTESKGAGASLKDIEVLSTATGPEVQLHGEAKAVAQAQGITSFQVSLSHSDDVAAAFVLAQK